MLLGFVPHSYLIYLDLRLIFIAVRTVHIKKFDIFLLKNMR